MKIREQIAKSKGMEREIWDDNFMMYIYWARTDIDNPLVFRRGYGRKFLLQKELFGLQSLQDLYDEVKRKLEPGEEILNSEYLQSLGVKL